MADLGWDWGSNPNTGSGWGVTIPQDSGLPGAGTWYAFPPISYGGGGGGDGGGGYSPPPPPKVYKTTTTDVQKNIMGYYNNVGNTYSVNNGYITDISIVPWMRAQQIVVRAHGLLFNTTVHNYFEGVNVDKFVKKPNVLELTNVNGSWREGDVIGYLNSGSFISTGYVIATQGYSDSNTTSRLYVVADNSANTYSPTGVISNGYFDENGTYITSTANGTISTITHNSGAVQNVNSSIQITLSSLASTVNNYYVGNTINFSVGGSMGQSATISTYNGTTKTANLSSSVTCNVGDIYSIGSFTTNESGDYYGIFNVPPSVFFSGEKTFVVDNRINDVANTATCWSSATFYSQGLSTTSQALEFSSSPSGAKDTFTQINTRTTVTVGGSQQSQDTVTTISDKVCELDPVAQTFIIDGNNYPNGVFIKSVKLFFQSKPTTESSPVTMYLINTLNGVPNGVTLDHGIVTVTADKVNISENPHYLDSSSYTEFSFDVPIYIQPDTLFAFMMRSPSKEYRLWSAAASDTAIPSTVKASPTSPTPTSITKINSTPYIGSIFLSSNGQTWTADQNQSLMFVIDRCVFDISQTPSIRFALPKQLPFRTQIDNISDTMNGSNAKNSLVASINNPVRCSVFNFSTTDFIPSTTSINYSYQASLEDGTPTSMAGISPGKLGSASFNNIYLDDGLGERYLNPNTTSSISVYAQLSSLDDSVSPILSDAGLSVYSIQNAINNCELSNNIIAITSGGSNYNANTTYVTVSSPTGKNGSQAYASANIANGVIQSVYVTNGGGGYITTPTITVTDANTTPGNGAIVTVSGETSSSGGNADARYLAKPITLDSNLISGDMVVYLTAYRPIGSDIHVYYKILNSDDTQPFTDSNWQLMTKINSCEALYSTVRDETYEYIFAPGANNVSSGSVSYTSKTTNQTYTTYNQVSIKIVLTSPDKTIVPYVDDMRFIALPPDTSTTFYSQ